ncbi:hypothetical protein CC78DRAFT_157776 [Lojkania enalia]|uniref:Uncharacterized protein n=1 Tax=Lojkania enalia TaxID=147567 RepID=A0A9P4MUL8_9PLEO|nr:hypothetical protein CC78DRAFT_157776 [Didymosphaeria enalia]
MVDTAHIAESKDVAIEEHNAMENEALCIYTDTSAINGHVGAAAIVLDQANEGCSTRILEYIGKSTASNIICCRTQRNRDGIPDGTRYTRVNKHLWQLHCLYRQSSRHPNPET